MVKHQRASASDRVTGCGPPWQDTEQCRQGRVQRPRTRRLQRNCRRVVSEGGPPEQHHVSATGEVAGGTSGPRLSDRSRDSEAALPRCVLSRVLGRTETVDWTVDRIVVFISHTIDIIFFSTELYSHCVRGSALRLNNLSRIDRKSVVRCKTLTHYKSAWHAARLVALAAPR